MTDFTIEGIVLIPALYAEPSYNGPAERCGENKWCLNSPSVTLKSCGTWLGQPNYCCWAVAQNTTNSILQPCNSIPQLQGATFDTVGKAAKNATSECPKGTNQFNDYGDGNVACCPAETRGVLAYSVPTGMGYSYTLDGYWCGQFTITDIVEEPPSGGNGNTGGESGGSPTSQAPSSSSTSTTGGSAEGKSTPNSASDSKSSKLASFVVGSVIFAMAVGAQL
ncbi:hypothetical protein TWF281_006804 [Arthrobotrys megalospora]